MHKVFAVIRREVLTRVRTRMFLVYAHDWEAVGRAHGEVFRDVRPASTMVVVSRLLDPRWRVEIEVDAVVD